jgi:hypothetical protein
MSDIIVQIPGATNVTVTDAPASAIVVTFPASTETVVTVIDRGILYGVQGPQGESGGVNTVNGQSGNVTLDTSEIPENPSYLYYTQARFDSAFAAKSTTNLAEGTNQYFTAVRVRAVVLTGISLVTNAVISATDTVLSAFGKLQAQITANLSTLTSHTSNTSNPHATTKSQVGLGNADNTSDANKPISTATQTALNAKQDTLVSNTNIKTVNSTTLLGSGDIAVQPTLVSGTSIKTVNSNSLLGAGDVAVQPTLVSGTNIKTLNSVSLLGSGDIVLAATPSGISGAIQFSDGSAFASDATKFFWDNTNKRFGIGTNAPSAIIAAVGSVTASSALARGVFFNNTLVAAANNDVLVGLDVNPTFTIGAFTGIKPIGIRTSSSFNQSYGIEINNNSAGNAASASIDLKSNTVQGSLFATSSTYANFGVLGSSSIGFYTTAKFAIAIDSTTQPFVIGIGSPPSEKFRINSNGNVLIATSTDSGYKLDVNGTVRIQNKLSVGTPTQASAVMEITSTTLGFLPPRMTTTQKNAIASPASGLIVYDTTLNVLTYYNGTTWI